MIGRLFQLGHLFLLLALGATSSLTYAQTARATALLTLALDKGALQIRSPLGLVLSITKVRLRFDDGSSVSSVLAAAVQDRGHDDAGAYERLRYRLQPVATLQTGRAQSFDATLEVRHYAQPDSIVVFLDYAGPVLAPADSVQLVTSIDNFARGLAVKRLKLYWTAPQFVSDYRLLGPSNQLLLWRQLRGDDYHLLVPLAGDGMIGEVGVSEIDYRYEFRVSAASRAANFTPRRVPLFAYATAPDPHRLPRDIYQTAFAASAQYGRLRWQKGYPEIFNWLGWCSWNAYGADVTEEKILASVRSLRAQHVPFGFVLVDDGWLSTRESKLVAFNADAHKFPRDLAGLARTLRDDYHVPHLGVWHTFQGYWSGVDANSEIGRAHQLFHGLDGKDMPDPRNGAGESFYADWYRQLKASGYDFVKVDGQGNTLKFTDGLLPLFASGLGAHKNLQTAAQKFFSHPAARRGSLCGRRRDQLHGDVFGERIQLARLERGAQQRRLLARHPAERQGTHLSERLQCLLDSELRLSRLGHVSIARCTRRVPCRRARRERRACLLHRCGGP